MATATSARAKSVTVAEDAGAGIQVDAPSRREFLFYIWGASILLITGELTIGTLWFAFPRFKEGEFGGTFNFSPEEIPPMGVAPETVPAGRFHIANVEDGMYALYMVCTHLGCLPKWVPTNDRFECPCHGSKFQLDGTYIEGPAPRSLDRFPLTITYGDNGEVIETNADGDALPVDFNRPIAKIEINTGSRIAGRSN